MRFIGEKLHMNTPTAAAPERPIIAIVAVFGFSGGVVDSRRAIISPAIDHKQPTMHPR